MKIIKLDKTDHTKIAQIFEIQTRAYQIEATLLGVQTLPPLRETIENIVTSDDDVFVYLVNDQPLGAIFFSKDAYRISINKLVVDPRHFRHGIARAILEHLFKTETFSSCQVSTGARNIPAIRLYESMGFRITNRERKEENLEIVSLEMHRP
jgi:ribosomal protein S18 acetylase RimI-like enzyme